MKRILCLALALALLLAGCGGKSETPAASGTQGQTAQTGTSAPRGDGALTEEEFFALLERAHTEAARFDDLMLDELAASLYGFAGASASAMRLAVERILWLRGEGDDFASFTAESLYTDWDTIAEISYFSPYPYYFEGLLHDLQGESEAAADDYLTAALMEDFPEQGLDFLYLAERPIDELYALRDRLRAEEGKIYADYRPVLCGYPRSMYCTVPEYHCERAVRSNNEGAFDDAVNFARFALRGNPRNEYHWQVAVVCAVNAAQYKQAAAWIEEGLYYYPDDAMLLNAKQAFLDFYEEYGKGAE